jgi:hypothetical protein
VYIVFSLLAVAPAPAETGSWVFLQDNPDKSLVRLSADGKSLTTIAKGAAGLGLAIDGAGNYIVGARKTLLRVTRAGVVKQIAAAPAGSSWTKVAVDAAGNFIVADGTKPAIWRVSADGASVVNVASYGNIDIDMPEGAERGLALAVDTTGDYLLLPTGVYRPPGVLRHIPNGVGPVYFLRVAPGGSVTEVPLRGVKLKQAGGMVPDGKGSYLVTDERGDQAVFRLTLDGLVTKVPGLEIAGLPVGLRDLARDPDTGAIIAIDFPGLGSVSRSAGEGEPLIFTGHRLQLAQAVVWDPGPVGRP